MFLITCVQKYPHPKAPTPWKELININTNHIAKIIIAVMNFEFFLSVTTPSIEEIGSLNNSTINADVFLASVLKSAFETDSFASLAVLTASFFNSSGFFICHFFISFL